MSKKNIIIISSIAAVVIIAILVILILRFSNKKTVKIEKYNDNFEVSKTVEIKNKKTVKKLDKMIIEENLNTENVPQDLGIKNDVKVSFDDGRFFMIQISLNNYCYYENPNTNTKIVINMPDGLIDIITKALEEN